MTTEIIKLESRQQHLREVMSKSDIHLIRSQKLGIPFGELYPDELAEYNVAYAEYKSNEEMLKELYEKEDQISIEE